MHVQAMLSAIVDVGALSFKSYDLQHLTVILEQQESEWESLLLVRRRH
jgi:hypothetical protein